MENSRPPSQLTQVFPLLEIVVKLFSRSKVFLRAVVAVEAGFSFFFLRREVEVEVVSDGRKANET